MLRLFVVFLVLANAAYFAWTQGYLVSLGLAPVPQSEPDRMQAQIKPDAIRLLNNTESRRIETPPATPTKPSECLQSPLLTDAQTSRLRAALDALPAGSWTLDAIDEPGRWIVYMGPYKDPNTLAKKKSELRGLGISYDTPQREGLLPGISLGSYPSQTEANQALTGLKQKGARSTRVAQELAPSKGQVLRLPELDDAVLAQLGPVKTALGAQSLLDCTP